MTIVHWTPIPAAVRRRCGEIRARDEKDLLVDMFRATGMHVSRGDDVLRRWAEVTSRIGEELAADVGTLDHALELTGYTVSFDRSSTPAARLVLGQCHERTREIVVHASAIDAVTQLADRLPAPEWTDPGTVRKAVIAHEAGHGLLHGDLRARLERELDAARLRIGRFRLGGHVVGADEAVSHVFARSLLGLQYSPLALNALLSEAAAHYTTGTHRPRTARRSA